MQLYQRRFSQSSLLKSSSFKPNNSAPCAAISVVCRSALSTAKLYSDKKHKLITHKKLKKCTSISYSPLKIIPNTPSIYTFYQIQIHSIVVNCGAHLRHLFSRHPASKTLFNRAIFNLMMLYDVGIRDVVNYLCYVDVNMDIAIVHRLKRDTTERARNVNELTIRYMRHRCQSSLKTI